VNIYRLNNYAYAFFSDNQLPLLRVATPITWDSRIQLTTSSDRNLKMAFEFLDTLIMDIYIYIL